MRAVELRGMRQRCQGSGCCKLDQLIVGSCSKRLWRMCFVERNGWLARCGVFHLERELQLPLAIGRPGCGKALLRNALRRAGG